MLPGGFQQTLFTKFLALTVQSFRNTIGVKEDGVARCARARPRDASPKRLCTDHFASSRVFGKVIPASDRGLCATTYLPRGCGSFACSGLK
jgi:hypothetical protein